MEEGDVECEGRESAEAAHRDLRIKKGKEEEGRKEGVGEEVGGYQEGIASSC